MHRLKKLAKVAKVLDNLYLVDGEALTMVVFRPSR